MLITFKHPHKIITAKIDPSVLCMNKEHTKRHVNAPVA